MHHTLKHRHAHGPDWFSRIIVAAFVVAAVTMLGYIAWSFTVRNVVPRIAESYTDPAPRVFSSPAIPEAELQTLEDRVETFTDAVKINAPQPPLEMTEAQLNALLQKEWQDDLENGSIRVRIERDRLLADLSVPLDDLAGTTWWRLADRYLTGTAAFHVALQSGKLDLRLASFAIDGDPVPNWLLDALDADNQLQKLMNDPDVLEVTQNLARVELTPGRMVLVPVQTAALADTAP